MGRGGCDKTAIVPALMFIGMLYMICSAVLIFLAISLASNNEASIGFGSEEVGTVPGNIGASVTCVFIAMIMCPLSVLGAYSARAHNKFLLLIYCGVSVFLMLTLSSTAADLLSLSNLPVNDESQFLCLKYIRTGVEDDVCEEYLSDVKVSRLRTLWVTLHDRGQNISFPNYKEWNTFMVKMQKGQVAGIGCCGFLRPSHCTGNSTEVCDPSVQSDPTEIHYETTDICNQGAGGCKFDKPMGICAYEKMQPFTTGCAVTLRLWIQNQMDTIGSIIQAMAILPLLAAVYSCCMTFKRKHEDVLPTKYIQEGGKV
jgi:hypothetical protein|tara:strand:- start:55 stop:993 length:939 start_codon:yes stop_codon:yes gene_type:complete